MAKIKIIATAVAVASTSTMAIAAPPAAPIVYHVGPFSPSLSQTNLSEQERVAYALLEGMMQAAEGYIHANGCPTSKLELPLSVYSDALGSPKILGDASLGSAPNIFKLNAVADNSGSFRGQFIDVTQSLAPLAQFINGKPTANFVNKMIYNSANNMMVGQMAVDTLGINGQLNSFTGYVIKDFYQGEDNREPGGDDILIGDSDLFLIIDWGLQSLSKEGYPVEKYWQRSKVRRSDGGQGQTVFVKDRLVGVTPCRITVSLAGLNGPSLFQQSGKLIIEYVAPAAGSAELDAVVSPAP
ncbi:MAG: hypothetical protein H6964_14055 [Chromatiaceae bacterium]|nr:hypothetical protein [Gammaproteobacteria bacterium]MCP5448101.1 hypothetical protein [Chromatiaceae bacterium]